MASPKDMDDKLTYLIKLQTLQIRLIAAYLAQDRKTLESLWKELEALS
jgi:hypothetical protein